MSKKEKDAVKQEEQATEQILNEEKVEKSLDNTLLNEIANLKDKSLRLQADFDNFRKRNASVVSKTREETTKDILKDLLAVADNLDRALSVMTDENTKKGIELVMNQVQAIFKKYDVVEMQSLGEEFNPNLHEAIMQEDNAEQAGKITMVFQKGYTIKDEVLRYATVRVAK